MDALGLGGVRGFFAIFVPGVFLLINLLLSFFILFIDTISNNLEYLSSKGIDIDLLTNSGLSSQFVVLVIIISFGYFIGVLLRLLRTDFPDRLSAAWLRRFYGFAKNDDGSFKLFAVEEFPYIEWLGEVCLMYLPPQAFDFYKEMWQERNIGTRNKQFFNFVKIIVSTSKESYSVEINAAESLSRYVAGMFYALLFSFILIIFVVIFSLIRDGSVQIGLFFLLVVYLLGLIQLLAQFRLIRIKEVETVFAVSYKNRNELFRELGERNSG